jgi:hypothetical protein
MRTLLALLLTGCLVGCAGTIDLEPVADKLDRAKVEHARAATIANGVFHVVCEGEPPLAPKAECRDLAQALALGEASSREALNAAIEAFNAVQAVAEEVQ